MMHWLPVAPVARLRESHRHVLSWRSYADPSKSASILIYRFPTPPENGEHSERSEELCGRWYSIANECPHMGAPLEQGQIEDDIEDIGSGVGEGAGAGPVILCPFHQYDFGLATGESSTGMTACTYRVEPRDDGLLWMEAPGTQREDWRLLGVRPVSEKFADTAPDIDTRLEALSLIASTPRSLRAFCILVLLTPSPTEKVLLTRRLVHAFRSGSLPISRGDDPPLPDEPLRPTGAKVMSAGQLPKRGKGGTLASRVKLLHALANIEQYAIDLAVDVCARFCDWRLGSADGKTGKRLPMSFFSDFLKVAEDEAKHFSLLEQRLSNFDTAYGSMPVHSTLWESATETAGSLFSRLAIIHLLHEARGLDVNPRQIERCRAAGDHKTADVIQLIKEDETTHVAAGHRHFVNLCESMSPALDPILAFRAEVSLNFYGSVRPPYNVEDRQKAGMSPSWYEDLVGRSWEKT